MAASLTRAQGVIVTAMEAYPEGYIYNIEDGTGPYRFRRKPNGDSVRLDGRVVYSLQRRKIITGHKPPLTMGDEDGAIIWTLNRSHPSLLQW